MPLARSSLGLGRKAEERVDLAVDKQLLGPNGTAGDPVDLRLWVDPHIGSDQRQEQMLGRSHRSEADLLAAEIGDAEDLFADEQLEAADMNPGQRLHRDVAARLRGVAGRSDPAVCCGSDGNNNLLNVPR